MSQDPRSTLLNSGKDFTETRRYDTYPFIGAENQNLSDKTVLITGASKGIGAGLAKTAARAGARTIILGARSSTSSVESEIIAAAQKANKDPPRIVSVALDVGNWNSVQEAVDKVRREVGHIDILVNNAGFLSKEQTIGDINVADLERTIQVNITGPMLMLHACLPLLLASPHPDRTVLTMSSGAAQFCVSGASAYGISKFAELRISEFADAEYGETSEHSSASGKPILAYSIHPGGIATDLANNLPAHVASWVLTDTLDLATDSIIWLLSERRSWLAGRFISCQWDFEELLAKKASIIENNLLKMRMAVE